MDTATWVRQLNKHPTSKASGILVKLPYPCCRTHFGLSEIPRDPPGIPGGSPGIPSAKNKKSQVPNFHGFVIDCGPHFDMIFGALSHKFTYFSTLIFASISGCVFMENGFQNGWSLSVR